jgi:hypothetical protein
VDADRETVEGLLAGYLGTIGAKAGYLEKHPDESASFSLLGPLALANEELREDLHLLLRNFDMAYVNVQDGRVCYAFAMLGR